MNNSIYPCLSFDDNAKEAAGFYVSVFGGRILDASPMVVHFMIEGQKFMALNGGPHFRINPSISFFVIYESEAETEKAFHLLSENGSVLMPLDRYEWSSRYAWVQDRYGVSWQLMTGTIPASGQKITPCIMFSGKQFGKAAEAIRLYTSVFDNSAIEMEVAFEPKDGVSGGLKHSRFSINGFDLVAMDSPQDHQFHFTEGVSIFVNCFSQEEIDRYWEAFAKEGEESQCGWIKDKFGLSWQIVPAVLAKLMSDPQRAPRVVQAFLRMKKFNIRAIEEA